MFFDVFVSNGMQVNGMKITDIIMPVESIHHVLINNIHTTNLFTGIKISLLRRQKSRNAQPICFDLALKHLQDKTQIAILTLV